MRIDRVDTGEQYLDVNGEVVIESIYIRLVDCEHDDFYKLMCMLNKYIEIIEDKEVV